MAVGSEVGVTTVLLVGALTVSASAPAGFYLAGIASGEIEIGSPTEMENVWVQVPSFTLPTRLNGKTVGETKVATTVKLGSVQDASRLCKFEPLIRDSFYSIQARTVVDVNRLNNEPNLSPVSYKVEETLKQILHGGAPHEVVMWSAQNPTSLKIQKSVSYCEDGVLVRNSNRKESDVGNPATNSIIF